ncbi:MAG TPA: M1 family metallopeptidase [Gemmatimonadota bacterium]|nr:M1 family metallopeptidase [Gemmatimonadota bacterium]
MIVRKLLVALAWIAATVPYAAAQESQTQVDERFREPDLPTPNAYRTASGRPGPEYWQQRVDYAIEATLDPASQTVTGSETITYANHSPDTLTYVWVQLDQNLFAPGSKGAQTFPEEARFGGGGFEGGTTIARVAADGRELETRIHDTLMRVDLARPLAPGGSTTFSIDWSFRVPEHGADRMGREGNHYLLAQWYPRLAVYDDVSGWNTMPYLGQGEFYLEYGDFTVALTVPAAYLVGATGALENPEEVLTATQRDRLAAAAGDTIVHVVTETELADPAGFRPRTDGMLTWRFRAENVRDFTWAASPEVVWDATRAGDALVHALYRPAARAWREAAAMTRHSIEFYSEYLGEYPYPNATAVEGPVYGMEYPMVVFVAGEADREALFDVLDHEWGHMWFPMVVGSDERRHAWMDEGIDTFINQLSKAVYFPESQPELANVAQYAGAIRVFPEQPMGNEPDLFASGGPALGIGAYIKPAVMLNALRALAGAEPFDRALRRYYEIWSYKHPQPADFFRVMENELGRELGWFWHNWTYTTATNDMAILGVDQNQSEGVWTVTVSVDQRGDLLMPARVVAVTATGATDTVTIPVEAFHLTDRATATLRLPERAERITVNGGPEWGDVNPQNNTWTR